MNNELGIMQGRLSPRSDGRYQSHPALYWQSEFFIAKELGLDLVEFILDSWSLPHNPLLSAGGLKEIRAITQRSEVGVKSICADVFMDHTFVSAKPEHDPLNAIALLNQTIDAAAELNIQDIVIPCVDRSSLVDELSQATFIKRIRPLCIEAAEKGVRINLETDLAPDVFVNVLDAIGRDKVWVNYDIGNSTSLGFDPREEFAAYGDRISDLHIKDRKLNAGSVELGTGDGEFDFIIRWLQQKQFSGQMIFQTARAESFVDDLVIVRSQIEWFKNKWKEIESA